jgi:hypothetical protein
MQTSPLFIILFRHAIAMFGGFFAANNISGDSTTSIIVGLALIAVPTVWSAIVKWLRLEEISPIGEIGKSEALRALLGSLVSQGVSALSTYLAVDANQPELLAGALINVGLSKAGLHQKVAFIGAQDALKICVACLCMLSLASCAGVTAFMASNAGQATVSLIDLGLNVAAAKGKISTGDNVAIQRGLAIVTNPADPTSVKVFSLAELGLQAAVARGAIKQGDALIIQEGAAIIKNAIIAPQPLEPKQPVNVKPVTLSHAEDDGPGCMQLAERIPDYGYRVAFALSTGSVRN